MRPTAGLPGDAIEAAREAAQKDAKEGWKFTLHFPSYFPVLQYADNRALRETLYAPMRRARRNSGRSTVTARPNGTTRRSSPMR